MKKLNLLFQLLTAGLFLYWVSPFIFNRYVLTVDGPAHLYNAWLIKELLFNGYTSAGQYFEFNDVLVPNWTGHIILSAFGLVFPPWLTEKILQLILLLGIPFMFGLFASRGRGSVTVSLILVFPMNVTLLFFLGFYNFLLSVFLLLVLVFYYRIWYFRSDLLRTSYLIILSLLLVFAHPVAFMIWILFWMVYRFGRYFLPGSGEDQMKESRSYPANWRKIIFRDLLLLLPGMMITFQFLLNAPLSGFRNEFEHIGLSTLIEWVAAARPLISLHEAEELPYTLGWFTLICIVLLFHLVNGWIVDHHPLIKGKIWFFIGLVIMSIYFLVPDAIAGGGFINIRLLYLFLVFVLLFITSNPLPAWLMSFTIAVTIHSMIMLSGLRGPDIGLLSKDVEEWESETGQMRNGTVVLPLSYTYNWLHTNISNYAGVFNGVIVLDNYEAKYGSFPLVWKEGISPGDRLGSFASSRNPVLVIDEYEAETGIRIDYVTVWHFNPEVADSTTTRTFSILDLEFSRISPRGDETLMIFARK